MTRSGQNRWLPFQCLGAAHERLGGKRETPGRCGLGTYTGAISDAELQTITVDYTMEFSRVLRASGPEAAFLILSGKGANPIGRSRMAFARNKGEAENALLAARFSRLDIFDPPTSTPWNRARNPISVSPVARDLPCLSLAFPQPGDLGGRFGSRHGEYCGRLSATAGFSKTTTSEQWSMRFACPE